MYHHAGSPIGPSQHDALPEFASVEGGFLRDELKIVDGRYVETHQRVPYAYVLLPSSTARVLAHQLRHPLLHTARHPETLVQSCRPAKARQTAQQMGLRRHII